MTSIGGWQVKAENYREKSVPIIIIIIYIWLLFTLLCVWYATIGNKPIIGAADPPLSPAFKALAESPLPQFFEALEKNPDIPELKQFTQATAPSPSPSPTLPPIKAK